MFPNKNDADEAILAGQAEAEEFMREFLQNWNSGGAKSYLRQKWMSVPGALKEKLKAQSPDQYRSVQDFVRKP